MPASRSASGAGPYPRFVALDGLRGLAAAVVVLHHGLLVSPVLADSYTSPRPSTPADREWWLISTPLHLVWAGPEAVYVFYVLSGFVLTLPYTDQRRLPWRAYYPRRLVRLYVPVRGSVALAVLLVLAVPRGSTSGYSWWMSEHQRDVDAGKLLQDLAILVDPGWYDTPLWSSTWELAFSLLLPLYLALSRIVRRVWVLAAAGCVAVTSSGLVVLLPMFAIGVLLAQHQSSVIAFCAARSRRHWAVLTTATVLLLTGVWLVPDVPGVLGLPVVGAVLLVVLFIGHPGAVRLATRSGVQWLRKVSFSLYLVHEPVLVTLAFVFDTTSPLPVLLAGVPLSLCAAALFFRLVERPSHRLANVVGARMGAPARPVAPRSEPLGRQDETSSA